jgi:hypothetical protein
MDTVGIEVPQVRRRFDRRLTAGAAAAVAVACVAGGYALGTSSDTASPTLTVIARGMPATWQDAVDEANAVKQHAAAAARAEPLDIRKARVER